VKTETNIVHFSNGIDLECGVRLNSFDLMVETYGELNNNKSNAVLVCHAFSGNHHAAGKSSDDDQVGWWDEIIGPNKAIDTNNYYVVCCNNLGGCSGSTGPISINPQNNEVYGKDFPAVSVNDWVESQKMLSDEMGIKEWNFIVGGSIGGMQSLQWAISFPDNVKKIGVFAAAAKSSTQNIAMNEVARESIRKDVDFHNGDYLKNNTKPRNGLKTARMLGHVTYLSEKHMDKKFGRKIQDTESKITGDVDYEVENYLQYKGGKFSDSYDANTYILMTKAMDQYDASLSAGGDLELALSKIKAKVLVIGFETDWLYPPKRGKEIQLAAMNVDVNCSYLTLYGEQGHDSFLFSNDRYKSIIKSYMASS